MGAFGSASAIFTGMRRKTVIGLTPPPLNLKQCCLFLDFDGTLVDIVERPEDVVVNEPLNRLLRRLQSVLEHRLAIVSGRSITQLDAFFGTGNTDLALVGSHGAEIRIGTRTVTAPPRPHALKGAEVFFKQVFADNPNMVIEVKSFGVAIHYRLDPAMEGTATKMAADFAMTHALELQHGKMMVELRTVGHDKGTAINRLISSAPFAGYTPVFIGDDLTDEPGFDACAANGGFGILVGPVRRTAAHYRLENVAAVHHWLETA
ncbi:trehalose-phosphatase [Sphingorhabdus sp.]|uniref:trehalose-phosphatase n=1 Tax=Sphingorhabdus sp. TaxID=1902408 RepID=UPI00391CBD6D